MVSSIQPHFVLIPLMAQGHMIPMIDMAKLFAERGVLVSVITTPCNAQRFQSTISRAEVLGLPIRLVQIPFPCKEVGLPLGYENLDILPTRDLLRKFFDAIQKLQQPLEEYLEGLSSNPPTCIISDKALAWTSLIAQKLNIPRIVFHGMCCFSLLSSHNVKLYDAHNSVDSDNKPFEVPGLPWKIKITKARLPGAFVKQPDLDDFRDKMQEAESKAFGIVVNSFEELEHGCAENYEMAMKKKVYCVGPVSLCNRASLDKFERGNKASIDQSRCLDWLDAMKSRSVIYACLGSLCRLVALQLIELGLSLEASKHPFIWVVKTGEEQASELEKWLSEENFEERVKGRGLVIRGWAPQVLILSHPAVGGFLTHCGWNSTIEAVCWGLPMITWPLFAEQFLNEKLAVEILRIGVGVGVEVPVRWGEEEKMGVLVKRQGIQKAIEKLMDVGVEGQKRRERAKELAEMAKAATEEGGSSNLNLSMLIKDVMDSTRKTKTDWMYRTHMT